MYTSYRFLAVPTVLLLVSGCGGTPAEEDGPLGSAESAALSTNALSTNALSTNALSTNALSTNALSTNALSTNALSTNALSTNAMAAIQDPSATGTLSRQLLEYTAGCALNPAQSVSISWNDADGDPQSATYYGQLGLAPEWANGPLTHRTSQELVSACLAARTNYFGVTVHISVRGSANVLESNTTNAELAAYPYVEGAFWGNLFSANPALYSCYDPRNVAHSRADQRECATGYVEANGHIDSCGMIQRTGSCDEQCIYLDPQNQFYWACGDDYTMNSVTIGLQ